MITVVETTTGERLNEAEELWKQIQPLVYDGWNFNKALIHVKKLNGGACIHRGWYKDLIEYLTSIGINYRDFTGQTRINKEWRIDYGEY